MSDEPETTPNEQRHEVVPAGAPAEVPVGVSQPAKLLRMGSMVREMLEEIRRAPLDEQGRERLREVYDRSIGELKQILSPELQAELTELHLPFDNTPTESELRIAQAQLMGWLEGLFHGIQAALWAAHMAAQEQASQFPRRMPPGGEQPRPGRYL